jgi:hypothetical protein
MSASVAFNRRSEQRSRRVLNGPGGFRFFGGVFMEPWMDRVVDLFLAGRLPGMNHARHVAVAQILKHVPHGQALMHLGLQVTATRAGVPQKYDAAVTDRYWGELDGVLPGRERFSDVL